jgi:hypothetical protein
LAQKLQYLSINEKEINMLNQLKTDEICDYQEEKIHYDAHIRAYQSQNMGIQVVLCDSEGIPVYDAVAPMSCYLPDTSYTM